MGYKRRRKYYIPITRSGSSMLASLLTQWIRQPREVKPATPIKPVDPSDFAIGCGVLLMGGLLLAAIILIVVKW